MARATVRDTSSMGMIISVEFERQLDEANEAGALRHALNNIAEKYAEEWIKKNLDKIYAQLDVKAISNLIMIEVAKQIKNNITDKEK